MKISEVIGARRAMKEDSLGGRLSDDGSIRAPGSEPTVVRIGGKLVRKHDPRLLPNVMPLSSKPIKVDGRKAMLWKGMDADGRTHVLWSYDTTSMAEDGDSYLQDPLDPEGDTDGPGKTGDQLDVGEGEVVQFKRPEIRPDAQNMQLAKSLANDLFWAQISSHYTPEEEAYEREIEEKLASIGYEAEWDLDAPESTMVITHIPSGRQYRMGKDELGAIEESDTDGMYESMDLGRLRSMADAAMKSIPGSAGTMGRIKLAAQALASVGAPLAILGTMIAGISSANAADRPQAMTKANATVMQFLKAYDAAKTEEERCRLANDWYGIKPPNDICDLSGRPMTNPDQTKCQDVYITRGANKGKTIRQCAEPEMLMPPRTESRRMTANEARGKHIQAAGARVRW